MAALAVGAANASVIPERGTPDERIRTAAYSSDEVYTLYGFVGYQIDLQFEEGESFLGMAAGDIEALSFISQGNHLFIKPKAPVVGTNLTVLTNRHQYQFEYTAALRHPTDRDEVIYVVRFTYPPVPKQMIVNRSAETDTALTLGPNSRPHNIDYWFCGDASVKPTSAWDDGVHTWLTFEPRAELPVIFVRNEDGAESLLNFSVEEGAVVIQRVAHRFILRRGKLTGCVVNAAFSGSGTELATHTISPQVERETRTMPKASAPGNGVVP